MEYDSFENYHPLVNFIYFMGVLFFTMFFMHPAYQAISFISALIYLIFIDGLEKNKTTILFTIFIVLFSTAFNPLFTHEGITIIAYMKNGNPITLESILFGLSSGFMFGAMMLWFASYNRVMTSDKFIYLFGRIIPALSLILSMVFRFVPRYKAKIKEISNSQKLIGRDITQGNIFRKIRNGLTILSIMTTWALENGIETSDSMRARGYGLKGRTSFSIYKINIRDKMALLFLGITILVVIISSIYELNTIKFYPYIKVASINIKTSIAYIAYLLLCIMPIAINIQEELKWKSIESKI